MSALWIAVLALSASPANPPDSTPAITPPSASAQAAVAPPRSGHALERATRDALRRWTRVSEKDTATAAHDLLALYKEIAQDQVLSAATRQDLRAKLRNRLARLSQQISKRLARQSQLAKTGPKSVEIDKHATVLNQVAMGGGQPGMGVPGPGGANNAAPKDGGQDLVDLIQTTIAPKSWEQNGGPGTIVYWQQQHVLVVRNTEEVHEQLTDLLDQLERAGH